MRSLDYIATNNCDIWDCALQWRHNERDGVYSDTDERKHQSSASLAFVGGIHRRPVNFPHNGPVTRIMFPFHDVIMEFAVAVKKLLRALTIRSVFRFFLSLFGRHLLHDTLRRHAKFQSDIKILTHTPTDFEIGQDFYRYIMMSCRIGYSLCG